MKFKLSFLISTLSFAFKMIASLLGLIFPVWIAKKVVQIAGVSGIVTSRTVTQGMSKYVIWVMAILAISSVLTYIAVYFMYKKHKWAFYFYALVQTLLAFALMYAGFNIYAGIEYLSVFCLLGILIYVFNWEYFRKSS